MKNSLPFTKIRSFVIILALLVLSGGIGYRLGERKITPREIITNPSVLNKTSPQSQDIDFSLFWDVWQRLERSYIDKADLEPQKMIEGAIRGMVASLGDPYTSFLTKQENKEFHEDLSGEFEGIGAQLGLKESRIVVVAPVKGAPAESAGVRAGDWILKVNDEDTLGWTVQQAVTKIRGPKGTTVALQILHDSEQKPVDIQITRNTITIPTVTSWIKGVGEIEEIRKTDVYDRIKSKTGRIIYLELNRFGDSTNADWEKAVADVRKNVNQNGNMKGIIFDLRNNPGGYLDGAVYIASEFIKSGIVVSQVNSDGTKTDYTVNRKGRLTDVPVVILVNKGTASASEIVAGALRDHKRATLVGEQTYGKGSVQTPQDLTGGSSLHVTTGKWLLPKGDSIHKKGIHPDVLISMDSNEASGDAQLAKAVELLLQ